MNLSLKFTEIQIENIFWNFRLTLFLFLVSRRILVSNSLPRLCFARGGSQNKLTLNCNYPPPQLIIRDADKNNSCSSREEGQQPTITRIRSSELIFEASNRLKNVQFGGLMLEIYFLCGLTISWWCAHIRIHSSKYYVFCKCSAPLYTGIIQSQNLSYKCIYLPFTFYCLHINWI